MSRISFPDCLAKINEPHWLAYVSTFPVAFAQVREDALIDQWVVNQLSPDSNGIMIGSGGCTAVFLANMEKLSRLSLVDMNSAQLALSQLKFRLAIQYTPIERLAILGHKPLSRQEREHYLLEAFSHLRYDANILGPIASVAELGPDYIGRYELLFKRLQYVLSDEKNIASLMCMNDPEKQKQFLEFNVNFTQNLKSGFDEVMALPNLVALFSKDAIQNSVMPFSDHFNKQTLQVIKTLPALTNPYLAQLLTCQFTETAVYPWLTLPKKSINCQMNYCLSTMANALSISQEKYDFIHLSNILDWLSKAQASELLDLAFKKLKKEGWIIIRQLNSSLDIPNLNPSLCWETEISRSLHKQDRSFFYQKLHLARK